MCPSESTQQEQRRWRESKDERNVFVLQTVNINETSPTWGLYYLVNLQFLYSKGVASKSPIFSTRSGLRWLIHESKKLRLPKFHDITGSLHWVSTNKKPFSVISFFYFSTGMKFSYMVITGSASKARKMEVINGDGSTKICKSKSNYPFKHDFIQLHRLVNLLVQNFNTRCT